MPELPEVETVRRGLRAVLPGRRIEAVETAEPFMLRDVTVDELAARVHGRMIEDVRRHGKFLLVVLDERLYLTLHLGMTGQLTLRSTRKAALPSHTRFVFRLSRRGIGAADAGSCEALVFRDVRMFGRVECTQGLPPARVQRLGPDALDGEWSRRDLAEMLRGRRTPIKSFLLDQRHLAGVGNIYADEILYTTRIRPDRPAGDLAAEEIEILAGEVRRCLAEGVRLRGCSISDFVDAEGRPGAYQHVLRAYGRHGEPCRTCGTALERIIVAGRGTSFCPVCQR